MDSRPPARAPSRGAMGRAAATSSGAAFMTDRLALLRDGQARPHPAVAAFDLDNTLFDSRARTLAAAHGFDAANGTRHFAALAVDQVGGDATSTCANLGTVSAEVCAQFAAFWASVFWDPQQFVRDPPLAPVVAWAERAHRAGAQVHFVTGRTTPYEQASLAQLARAGLGFATGAHLHLKAAPGVDTVDHKAAALTELGRHATVLWYLTESRREIASLQQRLPGLALVLLDCSLERAGPAVAPGTPMLPAVF